VTKQQSFFIRDESLSEIKKLKHRQNLLCDLSKKKSIKLKDLFSTQLPLEEIGKKNCENLIGSIEVPVGMAGPVTARINQKKTTYLIPLATTEGALVASIHRGLKILDSTTTLVKVKKIGMSRSIVIECSSIHDAEIFTDYFAKKAKLFAKFCEETSKHLKFLSYQVFPRDKLLYFRFVFDTDEAMGMNMVTIALAHAWDKFKRQLPDDIWVTLLTISGNVCTDKKDSMINRLLGRGYFVTLETKIPFKMVEQLLKVQPKNLVKTHMVKNIIGSNVAGSFSQNMHVANALGAFYLATGQDIAHVVAGSEASVHFELLDTEELYVALTLPNVSVGSIGGGTGLPKQTQARLAMMKKGMPTALDIAAGAGLAALAGEISGLAALTSNTLASAHNKLGRNHRKQT
jgi:hydroxymethylglutaryl-CoA reductase (NADPH)